jgi:putative membrane protein
MSRVACVAWPTCANDPDNAMGRWGHMMEYRYNGGFMWFIVVLMVGVAIYLKLQDSKSKDSNSSTIESPIDILKKRYTKGEIDTEEFESKKKDLES